MARKEPRDPYAPPPMHHDHSGAVLRIAIIALLLGGAVWGYTMYADQPRTPLVAETAEQQQVADAGAVAPETLPAAASESLPPTAPAQSAPQPSRTARVPAAEPAAADPLPPPSTTSTPTTPAPIPPS